MSELAITDFLILQQTCPVLAVYVVSATSLSTMLLSWWQNYN